MFGTPSTIGAASGPKAPIENFDGDNKQPNVNIEIHNVFSLADTEKTNGIIGAGNDQIKVFSAQNRTSDAF